MKINENIKISGQNVILIPYEIDHVEKYHKWMQSEELQNLTASEPLTLQEEYEMQLSWRIDENKCTFLILDKDHYEKTKNEIDSLVGDTNLFFQNNCQLRTAEAEIMIAEPTARRRGLGWESMLCMLKYGQLHLNCECYTAKIGYTNDKSIKMFEKLKFNEISRSDIFQEITFERIVTKEWIEWLDLNLKQFEISTYTQKIN